MLVRELGAGVRFTGGCRLSEDDWSHAADRAGGTPATVSEGERRLAARGGANHRSAAPGPALLPSI